MPTGVPSSGEAVYAAIADVRLRRVLLIFVDVDAAQALFHQIGKIERASLIEIVCRHCLNRRGNLIDGKVRARERRRFNDIPRELPALPNSKVTVRETVSPGATSTACDFVAKPGFETSRR